MHRKGKFIETESRAMVSQAGGGVGLTANSQEEIALCHENVYELDYGG